MSQLSNFLSQEPHRNFEQQLLLIQFIQLSFYISPSTTVVVYGHVCSTMLSATFNVINEQTAFHGKSPCGFLLSTQTTFLSKRRHFMILW